ncbi:MAG TPA: tetratricopeptide repeat protein [Pyrinomonadaceae bacterium]|nr:tetratricopeptide repeat protein [Pyrinomonadaceae bacterium]
MLEGQRYIWSGDRIRSATGRQNNVRLAKQAFQESVELDPLLSEGYTALAELAINGQPQDADEAIRLALLAIKVNPNNFGARRILARLYSFQSRLSGGTFVAEPGTKAIAEWKQVVRLDPRNAEAWALLSELYDRTGRTEESIDALRKWLASAAPVETRFYQMLMGGASLAPETASMKLGAAFLKAGRTREAIETIGVLVADDPDNAPAVELLQEAVENASPEMAALAVESLKQAVYANPENVPLINLLAQVQSRSGKVEDATKLLRDSSARLLAGDRASAAMLQIALGDMMARAEKPQEAIAAYEAGLVARGLDGADLVAEDEREFAMHVFGKMIQIFKSSDRTGEAKDVIERARKLLGPQDLFADREAISLLRETGNRAGALAAVKSVRARVPNDYGFIRLEATLLTETGKVDEAVALIKKLMETPVPPPATSIAGAGESIAVAVPASDAFSNYLFISNLYTQANRGKDAADAANQAYAVARGAERKQIARLTLATAQQMSGDVKGAEATLRELLKQTPGNPIAMNNLGYFLLDRDDRVQEAFDLIQQALKIDPTNPSYLDSLGWAYYRLGKLTEAEKSLKEALRVDSSSGTIHEHLGDVYHKQGKVDLARASWNKATSLFSDAADLARVKKKLVSKK